MSRRRVALAAVWVLPSVLLLSLTYCVYDHFRIEVPAPVTSDERAEIMAVLRTALESGETGRPANAGLDRRLPDDGPAVVQVWVDGQLRGRVDAHAPTYAEAIAEATRLLVAHPVLARLDPDARRRARIKVDLVVGRGPMYRGSEVLTAVALNPGLEGLGVTLDGAQQYLLLPDDLVLSRLLLAARPIDFIPDFTVGLSFDHADMTLARQAQLAPGAYGLADKRYWRFRTDAFVERPLEARGQGAPLPLVRGLPPAPELTAETLRQAALQGGRYLVAHLASNGRYIYERDLSTGHGTDPFRPGPYSIPRHAGTTYFLAELYRYTGEEWLREPIERAFMHLDELIRAGGCAGKLPDGADFACVVDKGQRVASLGSSALTVVALAEYQRATGDDRYEDMARRLTEWMLFMQRPDGSFAHLYNIPKATKDEDSQLLYYSGEAALALARMHEVTGEARYAEAAERGLDDLIGWYDFFAAGFFYGEDHWTCIAAEAIWPASRKPRYREFCDGYGRFLRDQQPEPGDHPDQAGWVGSYGFTPFIVPANTPAGSRTEAMISAYLLGTYHGQGDPDIREQILAAMAYTLGQQIGSDAAWNVHPAAQGLGAIPGSPIDRKVRIDYVQHVCSAMIRSIELIESGPR
jgi:hypothetical protein